MDEGEIEEDVNPRIMDRNRGGSIIQNKGEIKDEVNHRIQAG